MSILTHLGCLVLKETVLAKRSFDINAIAHSGLKFEIDPISTKHNPQSISRCYPSIYPLIYLRFMSNYIIIMVIRGFDKLFLVAINLV